VKKLWRYHRGKIAILVFVAAILFVNTPYTKALYKSAFLLLEIFPNSQVKPFGVFTKEPILKEVVYKSGDQEIHADLWIPNEKKKKYPAAVLHLGLDIDRKDERVTMIAEAIARTGTIVLTPNLPSLSNRRLTINTPTELRDSAIYLKSLNISDPKKLGFIALCAAGGPAFIASQSEQLKEVSFMVTINPFYDLNQLFTDVTSRKINGSDWKPSFKTVEIVNRETISGLEDKEDIEKLSELFVNIHVDKLSTGNFETLENPALQFNSQDSINTYFGLVNKDPKKSKSYLEASTTEQKNFMKNLSPSNYSKNTDQKIFVLSEIPNPYIPYTHARGFMNLGKTTLVEVDYTVAYPNKKPSLIDTIKSWYFVYRTLLYLS
jgi:hypothetical protein